MTTFYAIHLNGSEVRDAEGKIAARSADRALIERMAAEWNADAARRAGAPLAPAFAYTVAPATSQTYYDADGCEPL